MIDDSRLDSLLKQMAKDHHPELPSPGLIWWRAQILRKQREKERIEQPLIVMRWLAVVMCAVSLVLLGGRWGAFHTAITDSNRWFLTTGILAISVVSMAALYFLKSRTE